MKAFLKKSIAVVAAGAMLLGSTTAMAEEICKKEAVYAFGDAQGNIRRTVVTAHLTNPDGVDTIEDVAGLEKIEVTKGDAVMTRQEESIVWQTGGKDVYYRGESSQALPVSLRIRYTLDGAECLPEEMAGKSGHVRMDIEACNTETHAVKKDGEERMLPTPFAVISGVMLDTERFSDITVEGGLAIDMDGTKLAVGLMLPGLLEGIGMREERAGEYTATVRIEADVEEFEWPGIYALAVGAGDMTLREGALDSDDTLKEAVNEWLTGLPVTSDMIETLYEKIEALIDHAVELRDGTHALAEGMTELTSHSAELTDGSAQVFAALLSTANAQLSASGLDVPELTAENWQTVLAGLKEEKTVTAAVREQVAAKVHAQYDALCAAVTQAVEAQVKEAVTEAAREQVLEKVLASANMTVEAYEQGIAAGVVDSDTQAKIEAAVAQQLESEQVQALIQSQIQEQMASEEIGALIETKAREQETQLVQEAMESQEVRTQIAQAVGQLSGLYEQLSSYQTFHEGLEAYTKGAQEAADGAAALRDGIDGAFDGLQCMETMDGLHYEGFSGVKGNMPCTTVFIYRLDAIRGE